MPVTRITMLISKKKRGSSCLYEVGWLFGVKSLKSSQDKIISFDDIRLFRIVSISGHGGINLIKMFCCFDYIFELFFHLNMFKLYLVKSFTQLPFYLHSCYRDATFIVIVCLLIFLSIRQSNMSISFKDLCLYQIQLCTS